MKLIELRTLFSKGDLKERCLLTLRHFRIASQSGYHPGYGQRLDEPVYGADATAGFVYEFFVGDIFKIQRQDRPRKTSLLSIGKLIIAQDELQSRFQRCVARLGSMLGMLQQAARAVSRLAAYSDQSAFSPSGHASNHDIGVVQKRGSLMSHMPARYRQSRLARRKCSTFPRARSVTKSACAKALWPADATKSLFACNTSGCCKIGCCRGRQPCATCRHSERPWHKWPDQTT